MQWNSWTEFWAMGGYGLYVWGSYAAVALWLLAEQVSLRVQRRRVLELLQERVLEERA